MELLADVVTSQPYAGVKMKFDKKHEMPALDSVMHVTLASVLIAFVLVSTFPALQAMFV